jgi:predicted RNA-binding Zn-ribbon protein involved in translation (DUF1610 family)
MIKVKMETTFFVVCPHCDSDEQHIVDSYENSEFQCPSCGRKDEYNSEPENCEAV